MDFNTLTVVNRANSQRPAEVYRFLKQIGSQFLQFIPLVERPASAPARALGLDFAEPPDPGQPVASPSPVTDESVQAEQYGQFLCAIFDEWVRERCGQGFRPIV